MGIVGKHTSRPGALSVVSLIAAAGLTGITSTAVAADEDESAKLAEEAASGGAGEASGEASGVAEDALPASLKLSGALRFNYFFKSWEGEEANRDRLGDLAFEVIQIGADAEYGPLTLSMGYRYYQDYDVLHHAYLGYALSDTAQIDVGVVQAPFGILPFASHGWFLNLGYYMGFEDDYDTGVRGTFELGNLDLRVAFFKNGEGSYRGASLASTRYSYDVVPIGAMELAYAGLDEARSNRESNQLNARVAYKLDHDEAGATEVGVSGRVGGLYNDATQDYGYHWAAAAHADGRYGPLHVQLQGLAYQLNPSNPAGQSDDFIIMGAFDAPYMVASAGYLFLANVAYTLPVNRGPLDEITLYNDYSILLKSEGSYPITHHEVVGLMAHAGPIYTFVDLAIGSHHPWLGPSYGTAFAAGNINADGTLEDNPWHTRLNVNLGYYF